MGQSGVDTTVFVIQDNHTNLLLWISKSAVLKGFLNNKQKKCVTITELLGMPSFIF